jgi:molybdate transport system regulatory protein
MAVFTIFFLLHPWSCRQRNNEGLRKSKGIWYLDVIGSQTPSRPLISMSKDISKSNKSLQLTDGISAPDNDGMLPEEGPCLDTIQLNDLEQSFRQWCEMTPRRDIRLSRRRILLVFLLIRYTGAKLNEILSLNPFTDIDDRTVCIPVADAAQPCARRISIAESLGREIREALAEPDFRQSLTKLFSVDPAFVRRKFYERAEACGFPRRLGGPEMIRRARAVELLRGNMPLPAVQMLLGHSTPNLTTAHVSFSEEELQQVAKMYIERESSRTTSARNAFFGKIVEIERGDVQARISLINLGGHRVSSIITRESLERLGLQLGRLVTAEVKAPWIILQQGITLSACSADNHFQGTIIRINKGKVNSEYVVRIDDGTELCAVTSSSSGTMLGLDVGDMVWAVFNGFAVILHADD